MLSATAEERQYERHVRPAPRQALDVSHLRRPFDGQRVQQALSLQSRQGPDRSLHRLRSADADRLRLRPHSLARRGRQGRRAGLASWRHAHALRRHSDRRDEHVDDHQRHRRVADGALYRRRGGTGRAARKTAGHDAKRHHQGISVARLLCVSADAVAAPHARPHSLHHEGMPQVQSDERLLLPSAGSGRDAVAGIGLCARDRRRHSRRRESRGNA